MVIATTLQIMLIPQWKTQELVLPNNHDKILGEPKVPKEQLKSESIICKTLEPYNCFPVNV